MRNRPKQLGQSMVEYTVVLAFGVMILVGPGGDVIQGLLDVIKQNYRGYSFAMSISAPPDFDDSDDYYDALVNDYGLEDEDAERLAVSTLDLASDITGYDLSPLDQLDEISSFSDVGSIIQEEIEDELQGAVSFFP